MEYQLRLDRPLDHQHIERVVKAWLRGSPAVGRAGLFATPARPVVPTHYPSLPTTFWPAPQPVVAGRGLGPQLPRAVVGSPAQNVFSSHQMQTAVETLLAPGVHLRQLSQMGGNYAHVFVVNGRDLLYVQQAGLHAEWVRLNQGWHTPFLSVMPSRPNNGLLAGVQSGSGYGGLVNPVSWQSGADADVRSMSAWQKLLAAAYEGVKQSGDQAYELIVKPLLSWEGALTMVGLTGLLLIPYVGEVVLVGLMGVAIYDLLKNVTRLFKLYHDKAVGAQSWSDLREAGKWFAQAVVMGLLDVLAVFVGASALARLRALRLAGKLTVRAWVVVIEEQAQALRARLRGGIKKISDLVKEQQQQKPQVNKLQPLPRTPHPMNTLTDPQAMLDEALYRQGKKSGDPYPGGYKEKWSENGYDYEARVHQPPANAPAGSNSSKGPTYRVSRRKQGLDPSSLGGKGGYGWEYVNKNGNWYKERDLKANTDPTASNNTHIPLPNGTIK